MTVPSTAIQVLVTLVLVIPGFVFQATRIRLVGRSLGDADLAGRILRAIVLSTIFALIYLFAIGPTIISEESPSDLILKNPRTSAFLGLVGAFLLPAAVAALPASPRIIGSAYAATGFKNTVLALAPSAWTRHDNRPAAWDVAFQTAEEGWYVRIKHSDGTWYAGYWGPSSWASTYPDPPTLFVETEHLVDDQGVIGDEVSGSKGTVIQCGDAILIELLESPPNPIH